MGRTLFDECSGIDKEHEELFKISKRILKMVDNKEVQDSRKRTFMIREGVKYVLSYWQKHTRTEEALYAVD